MATKKKKTRQTNKRAASAASRTLRNPKATQRRGERARPGSAEGKEEGREQEGREQEGREQEGRPLAGELKTRAVQREARDQ